MDVQYPQTLAEAIRLYADPEIAHRFVVAMRWPHAVACPRMGCGSANVHFITTRKTWRCNDCKRQFSTKVGTIFEESPLGYDKWLPAIWLITNAKNGISSCEIARGLGVTQKTAWFMLHRIRAAMKSGTFEKLAGPIEADETYVGGRRDRMSIRRRARFMKEHGTNAGGAVGKAIVMGLLQRGQGGRKAKVRAFVVPSTHRNVLRKEIFQNVEAGSTLFTDGLAAYEGLWRAGYNHHAIDHAFEYVRGKVHTNSIEAFWSVQAHDQGDIYRPASTTSTAVRRRASPPL